MPNGRDGTSPSPTPAAAPARGPNIAADTRAVGATLVVARAQHAERAGRDKPVPYAGGRARQGRRTWRRVAASRGGDPCGRPRRARRTVAGRDKPVPYADLMAPARAPHIAAGPPRAVGATLVVARASLPADSVDSHENAEHSRHAPAGRAGTGQARPLRVRNARRRRRWRWCRRCGSCFRRWRSTPRCP